MAVMVWKFIVYHDSRVHVIAPVSIISTGLPSCHKPVGRFEEDFSGIELFVKKIIGEKDERIISDLESKEAYMEIFRHFGVKSWRQLVEKFGSYEILPKERGNYVISRLKFYNSKFQKGLDRDVKFPDKGFNLAESGDLSRKLAEIFSN